MDPTLLFYSVIWHIILLCQMPYHFTMSIMPVDFTYQGESAATQWIDNHVNSLSGNEPI